MAEAPNIPDTTGYNHRHAELVSAPIMPFQNLSSDQKWALKQVQGDEPGGSA
ncbi:MAG: hypothetical protein AAGM33_11015 [Pseudomonadota bacterium]